MGYTIQNVIDRAKIYVDDNHKVTDGWKEPADWLAIARPELISVYRKWVRESMVAYNPLTAPFTGPTFTFSGTIPPLAILGVAQVNGTQTRFIQSAMSEYGRQPYFDDTTTGIAITWTSGIDPFPDGNGDLTYSLTLHPPDTSSGYIVKYIRYPEVSALDKFVMVPEGYEDYIALRIARKALASEGASSQALERLIISAEAEIKMDSLSNTQGDGPKVRVVRSYNKQRFYSNSTMWPLNPLYWFYP